jgi:hypothetical protein
MPGMVPFSKIGGSGEGLGPVLSGLQAGRMMNGAPSGRLGGLGRVVKGVPTFQRSASFGSPGGGVDVGPGMLPPLSGHLPACTLKLSNLQRLGRSGW